MGDQLLKVLAGSLLLTALVFVAIAAIDAGPGNPVVGLVIVALLFGAGAALMFGAVARRRRASF